MALQKLTDKTLFAATLSLSDLIHVVDVSDTSQNASGSSFKLQLSQLQSLINTNFANTNLTLSANRTHDLNSNTLGFINGFVGIGTGSPTDDLHIRTAAPSILLEQISGVNILYQAGVLSDFTGLGTYSGFSTTTGFTISRSLAKNFVINSSTGRVGIFTDTPTDTFQVQGTNSVIGNVGAGALSLSGTRLYVKGENDLNTHFALKVQNNSGSDILSIKNNGAFEYFGASAVKKVELGNSSGDGYLVVYDASGTPTVDLYGLSTNRSAFKQKVTIGYLDGATPTSQLNVRNQSGVTQGIRWENSSSQLLMLTQTSSSQPALTLYNTSGSPIVDLWAQTGTADSRSAFVTDVGIGNLFASGTSARLHVRGENDLNTHFALKVQNNSATDILSVRNDGLVGIGTTSPTSKLHVNSTNATTDDITLSKNGTVQAYLGYFTNGGYIQLSNAVGSTNTVRLNNAIGADFINTGANLGIGTSNPTTKLQVNSTAINGEITLTKSGVIQAYLAYYDTRGGYLNLQNAAGSASLVKFNDGAPDHINTGHNLGIGLIAPLTKLHVNSTATQDYITVSKSGLNQAFIGYGTTNGGAFSLVDAAGVNNKVQLNVAADDFINTGFNFGVGTITPSQKLDVLGDAKLGAVSGAQGSRVIGRGEHTSAPGGTLAIGEWEMTVYDNGATPVFRVRYNDNTIIKTADVALV